MKKVICAVLLITGAAMTAAAQDWSEYSRGSDAWKRHNRDALVHPWKYDRGGRLKKGSPYGRSAAKRRAAASHTRKARKPRRR